MEKYDGAVEATDDNMILRMRFASCMTKSINTDTQNM